jgi:hypothetical protein
VLLVAAPSAEGYVYWTSLNSGTSQVGRANLDGGGIKSSLVSGAYFASGTASDGTDVFWGNSGNGTSTQASVGRATVQGASPGPFQSAGTYCGVFDVQVDATNLYWLKSTCSGTFAIDRAPKTGGSGGSQVASANSICGFAIDRTHLYWSTGQYIGRSLLDGSSPDPTWLNLGAGITGCGLAVDAGHIYWTQVLGAPTFRGTNIGRATINGDPASVNNSFITGASFTSNPSSAIAVDSSHIYWTNNPAIKQTTGSIGRATLDGKNVQQSFVPKVFNPDGLAVDSLGAGGGKHTLTVRMTGSGSGRVRGPGINCPGDCSESYASGTSIALTATPGSGAKFVGWSGGCSGIGSCHLTMRADRTVGATFNAKPVPPAVPNTKIGRTKVESKKGNAIFEFSATGKSLGFQCALVKKHKGRAHKPRFRRCASPKRYTQLKPAKYIFEVRAVGVAGPDASPAEKKFRIA